MNIDQKKFIESATLAAKDAGHLFPEYAAAEAALESKFGTSQLCAKHNNLFGMKQHRKPVYETVTIPTREWNGTEFVTVVAKWIKYPSWKESFTDRMDTLKRLSDLYPLTYGAALDASNGEEFIQKVSKTWSTDPKRADKVLKVLSTFKASV